MVFENFGLVYVKCSHFKINVIVIFVQLLTCMNEFFFWIVRCVMTVQYQVMWCDGAQQKKPKILSFILTSRTTTLCIFYSRQKSVLSLSISLSAIPKTNKTKQFKNCNWKTMVNRDQGFSTVGSRQVFWVEWI